MDEAHLIGGVLDPEDEGSYLSPLESAGYQLRVREPEHRMLRTAARDVHVHVCALNSPWERRHLLFRDWLRHAPEDAALYVDVKQRLVPRGLTDMNAYAESKGAVVADIMSRAEAWATTAGWRGRT